MHNFDNVKERIKNRRYQTIIKQNREENIFTDSSNYKKKRKSPFLSFCMPVLTILVLALGVLIYAKKDEKATFLQEKLGINLSFVNLNAKASTFVDKIINLNIFSQGNSTIPVSNEPLYVSLGSNLYTNDTNSVLSVGDGTVIYAQTDSTNKYLVVVQHDLGYTASYYNLAECQVELYDRLTDRDLLGTFEGESVQIIFSMNNTNYTYEEILELVDKD